MNENIETSFEMSELDLDKALNDLEESAETVQKKEKVEHKKREKQCDIPFKFIINNEDNTLINKLRIYINSKNYTRQDFIDYCTEKCHGDPQAGKSLANNTVSGLEKGRDIRSSTIDLLCDFLKVDIIVEEI